MPPLPPEDIFGNTKKLHFVLDALSRRRTKLGRRLRVLDFGCGNAEAAGQYLIAQDIDYVGVDFHAPSLDHARTRFGGPTARFYQSVPADETFDAIVYADVLEHLPDPLAVLRDHVRQLAPDGIVVGSVPNGYGPCEIEKYVDRMLGLYRIARGVARSSRRLLGKSQALRESYPPYNVESGHLIFFTQRSLRAMVDSASLEIERFAHGGFVGADLTGSTIFSFKSFIKFNVAVADRLPSWMVSTWYFVLTHARASVRDR